MGLDQMNNWNLIAFNMIIRKSLVQLLF